MTLRTFAVALAAASLALYWGSTICGAAALASAAEEARTTEAGAGGRSETTALELYEVGRRAYNNDRFETAIQAWEKAISVVDENDLMLRTKIQRGLGEAYREAGREVEAARAFQLLADLYSSDTDAQAYGKASALVDLSLVYIRLGKTREASDRLKEALALLSESEAGPDLESLALNRLILILNAERRDAEALMRCERRADLAIEIGLEFARGGSKESLALCSAIAARSGESKEAERYAEIAERIAGTE